MDQEYVRKLEERLSQIKSEYISIGEELNERKERNKYLRNRINALIDERKDIAVEIANEIMRA